MGSPPTGAVSILSKAGILTHSVTPAARWEITASSSTRRPDGARAMTAAGVGADNEIIWSARVTRVVASKSVFLK